MNLSIIEEPELEFGGNNRHVDIRFGIKDYGPFDLQSPRAPKEIRIGLVGTAETTEGAARWIEKCKRGIPQKPTKQPNLFPAFPEVSSSSSFCCNFVTDATLTRSMPGASIEDMEIQTDVGLRIEAAGEMLVREIQFLAENANPNVILCALPLELLELLAEDTRVPGRKDLHHVRAGAKIDHVAPRQRRDVAE